VSGTEFVGAFSNPIVRVDCAPDSGLTIKCPTFPTSAGTDVNVWYDQRQAASGYGVDSNVGLQNVTVEFNYGGPISPCAGPAAPSGSQSQASVADACIPPSHLRITKATIKRNSASFRFTARHAASFECELLRNKHVMFRHSCHSPKPYASPLPRGDYTFVLTALNRAGVARKPATKKFTIK
jgi:hypothetical protein